VQHCSEKNPEKAGFHLALFDFLNKANTSKKLEKAKFCLAFLVFEERPNTSKKARFSQAGLKKAKLATLILWPTQNSTQRSSMVI